MPAATVAFLSVNDGTASAFVDVAFICAGFTAFGISAFLLAMIQVDLPSLYLHLSTLLAFAVSVFDLNQLSARSNHSVFLGFDADSVRGLFYTRELSLALSNGFRFMYFWMLVSERPRDEPPLTLQDPSAKYEPEYRRHSASWQRWGYLGFVLKWATLALTVVIPVMQIVWRIFQRHYGVAYTVESTIEIVASSLFILKLFFNAILSPVIHSLVSPWWLRFLSYLGPIVALLISLGIGIGQFVISAFSETTLGRFLQALELYILIGFLLMDIFYITPAMRRLQVRKSQTSSSNDSGVCRSSYSLPRHTRTGSVYHDTLDSTWNTRRKSSRPYSSGQTTLLLWDRNDPELGGSPDLPYRTPTTEIVYAAFDVRVHPRLQSFKDTLLHLPSPYSKRAPTNKGLPPLAKTDASFSSYYMEVHSSSLPAPKPIFVSEASSPYSHSRIHGLNSIIIKAMGDRSPTGTNRKSLKSRSTASFDKLLCQLVKLDQSVAMLRLFSPSAPTFPDAEDATTPGARGKSSLMVPTASRNTASYTDTEGGSSPLPSAFSLSFFPEPPTYGFALPDTPVTSFAGRGIVPPRAENVSPDVLKTSSTIDEASDVETMDASPTIATGSNNSVQPLLLNPATPSPASLPSREIYSFVDPVSARQTAAPQPFLLRNDTSTPAISSSYSATPSTDSRKPTIRRRRPIPTLGTGKRNEELKLRLSLNLEVDISIRAKVGGDITLSLFA
ncbi:hypothetical protein IW261DRAFT_1026439 [Armillaria novae-zelandiae]|uniref:Uncharacterized protein n=1 Tax=Armillaria novae-zelandiae TaxID=153914 RepID=A0AA39PDM5_9AGAR|nr:hypothetical protein IW261DRAFT_1026439 [Armillaria novae-zelandiae]